MEYLINNIFLIAAILLALIKITVIGCIGFCIVQTVVWQISKKKISLYNMFEKHMLKELY